jgi:acyl dehydratase
MQTSEILGMKGTDLGYSDWFTMDQQRVNDFADVTIDHQFIHVDEAAAAAGPSRLVTPLENLVMGINYGFEKIRFLAPVPVGSSIRAHVKIADVAERKPGQFLFVHDVTVEIRGEDKPALVAQWLSLQVTAQTS